MGRFLKQFRTPQMVSLIYSGSNISINNNTKDSIGLHLLDDTWINQRGSPDTSENFQLKMTEIKKKAETPKNSKISQAKTFTIINNPQRVNSQFKIFKKIPKNCGFDSVNQENNEIKGTIKNSILPGDIPGNSSNVANIISNEVIQTDLPLTQNLLKKLSIEEEIPVANEFIGMNKTNPTFSNSNYIPKLRSISNSHNNLIDLSQYSFYQQDQYDCNDEMNDSDIKNRELGSKSINPKFIEKNNTSTRFSTNESNESFESKYNPQNCEEKFSYNFNTPKINRNYNQINNYSNDKSNYPVNNIIPNNNFYVTGPNPLPQYLNFNSPNIFLNTNFYENDMAHTQSRQKMNFQCFPENAFSFNVDPSAGGQKSFSEKKKLKKSKEELDQTLFIINTQNIIEGKDKRTTIMIRHIPNKYSNQSLLDEINFSFKGKYDFFYLPMDFEVKF
jgi:hypothetical protein